MTPRRRDALLLLALTAVGSCEPAFELTVEIEPRRAREDGARWRIDGGPWRSSGDSISARGGPELRVEFDPLPEGVACPVAPRPVSVRTDGRGRRRWVGLYTGATCEAETYSGPGGGARALSARIPYRPK